MILRAEVGNVVDLKVFVPLLKEWFRSEFHKIFSVPRAPGPPVWRPDGSHDHSAGLLMGCPLWSQPRPDGSTDSDYIDRFFHFCLPSIMAKQNMEALAGNCRMVIFTNQDSFDRFWLMRRDIEARGIETVICVIPEAIMEHLSGVISPDLSPDEREDVKRKRALNKYWLLGTVQQLLIQMAGRAGLGFHMLMPDHLYSEAYFANLFRLAAEGYEGLAQTGISADIRPCLIEMEKWRKEDGTLEAPDRELGDMGWRHLHKQMLHNLMNGQDLTKDAYPLSHYIFWKGKEKLYLFCCHMNAAYLSPRQCQGAPVRLHNALDTELPYYMPERFGIVTAEDGMAFLELSDERKLNDTQRVPFSAFAAQCWMTVFFKDDYKVFFSTPNTVWIEPNEDGAEEEEILRQHAIIFQSMVAAKEDIKTKIDALEAQREAELAREAAD